MRKGCMYSSLLVVSLALLTLAVPSASASTIYATGFEPLIFTLGGLEGQDGWITGTGVLAEVQNFNVNSGAQAVIVVSNVNGPEVAKLSPVNGATNPLVLLQTDFYLSTQVAVPAVWSIIAANFNSELIGGVNLIPDGTIEVLTPGVPAVTAAFTRDAWHTLAILMDFSTQKFMLGLDGSLLYGASPFVTPSTGYLGSVLFSAGSTEDVIFLDNYMVAASDVPEPATLGLSALSVVALFALRRKIRVQ